MANLKFENIYKTYEGGFTAVKDFNLEIADKEFIVFVGPSGCGKSTTLRMVAGLEEISSGKLYIGDQLVNDLAPKDRDIAMVFQNYALYPQMTVRENMSYSLKLKKTAKEEIDSKVLQAAKILGLEDLLDRKPKALSGGQRQRVALGRAIVRNPKVFLMDEPLSNLDAKLRVQTRAEISRLHEKLQTTFIYVTHDQTEAMTMGDRIVIMNEGLIQQVDSPSAVYLNPKNLFVAGFIGSPQMNFIRGRLLKENGEYFIENSSMKVQIMAADGRDLEAKAYLNKDLLIGLRPEHIYDQMDQATVEVQAQVDFMEMLGAEKYLYLKLKDLDLIARFRSTSDIAKGQQVKVYLDKSKIHFFDIDTEENILYREREEREKQ
ncbi:MAG: sn-glycerol-3-phosphate ABC transporter ATP-binding protein UgpC [Bacillota bacterium]|nr:sn-glycerol-3-phosphate ABC transporter ATP-binding protein UgpC [Bacillota bacterium]